MRRCANYALVYVGARLGPVEGTLGVDGMHFVGDETPTHEFEVPTDDATDTYLGIQAYDVEEFGHEILVNGESLSGFDLPPADGWQYWMDSLADVALHEGTNTLAVRRQENSLDSFAVGNVTINWRETV